ncbi:hypothetical protein GA0115240_145830 [Streptomyces sp. DvalAA-14]|nr:hypothetical protein GA0115240_145830 [Streptomyces sp. DvalAA-14]
MDLQALPRRCHESELAGLSRTCPYCKRTVHPVSVKVETTEPRPDPFYTLDWFCPDRECTGKTRLK